MFVMTVDQRGSRRDEDRVPALLADVASRPLVRAFERTAGDEVQGVLDDPATVLSVTLDLIRDRHWSVGIGVGDVDLPLPTQTRAGRGPAFESARAAIDAAKGLRPSVAVRGADAVACSHAQTALHLLVDLITGRSPAGVAAVRLVEGGATGVAAAETLGISPQALSQRLRAARWHLEEPTRELTVDLLGRAEEGSSR